MGKITTEGLCESIETLDDKIKKTSLDKKQKQSIKEKIKTIKDLLYDYKNRKEPMGNLSSVEPLNNILARLESISPSSSPTAEEIVDCLTSVETDVRTWSKQHRIIQRRKRGARAAGVTGEIMECVASVLGCLNDVIGYYINNKDLLFHITLGLAGFGVFLGIAAAFIDIGQEINDGDQESDNRPLARVRSKGRWIVLAIPAIIFVVASLLGKILLQPWLIMIFAIVLGGVSIPTVIVFIIRKWGTKNPFILNGSEEAYAKGKIDKLSIFRGRHIQISYAFQEKIPFSTKDTAYSSTETCESSGSDSEKKEKSKTEETIETKVEPINDNEKDLLVQYAQKKEKVIYGLIAAVSIVVIVILFLLNCQISHEKTLEAMKDKSGVIIECTKPRFIDAKELNLEILEEPTKTNQYEGAHIVSESAKKYTIALQGEKADLKTVFFPIPSEIDARRMKICFVDAAGVIKDEVLKEMTVINGQKYAKIESNKNGTYIIGEEQLKVTLYLDEAKQLQYKQLYVDDNSPVVEPNAPRRRGYKFARWSHDGAEYSWEAGVTTNLDLYAEWDAEEYTVEFDSDGGTSCEPKAVTYDASYTMPRTEKVGYTFWGWYYEGIEYGQGVWKIADNVTLVAHWMPNSYTVKYNVIIPANASHTVKNIPVDATWTYDTNATLAAAPSLEGWKFDGWYKDNDCREKVGDANETLIKPNYTSTPGAKVNIYTKWTPISYTVTYNGNKPANASHTVKNIPVDAIWTYDTNATLAAAPSLEGWKFDGWYKDNDCREKAGNPNGILIKPNYTSTPGVKVNIYAKWTPISYSVSYNGNEPANASHTVKDIPVDATWTYDKNATLAVAPSLEGWKFDGWYKDNDCREKAGNPNGSLIKPNYTSTPGAKVNIYAKWTPISYIISYNGNGASGGNMEEQTFTYDVPSSLNNNQFCKKGYVFSHWKSSINGQEHEYADGEEISNLSFFPGIKITFTAQWRNPAQLYSTKFSTDIYCESTCMGSCTFDVEGVKVIYEGSYYIYGSAYSEVTFSNQFADIARIDFKNSSQEILWGGIFHWARIDGNNNDRGTAVWDKDSGFNSKNISYMPEDTTQFMGDNRKEIFSITDICVKCKDQTNPGYSVPEIARTSFTANVLCEQRACGKVTIDVIGIKTIYNNNYYIVGNGYYSGRPENASDYNDIDEFYLTDCTREVLFGGTMFWQTKYDSEANTFIGNYNQNGSAAKEIRYIPENPNKDFYGSNPSGIKISITGICVKYDEVDNDKLGVAPIIVNYVKGNRITTNLYLNDKCQNNSANWTKEANDIKLAVTGLLVVNDKGEEYVYGHAFASGVTGGRQYAAGTGWNTYEIQLETLKDRILFGGCLQWYGNKNAYYETGISGFDVKRHSYFTDDISKDWYLNHSNEISITGICLKRP